MYQNVSTWLPFGIPLVDQKFKRNNCTLKQANNPFITIKKSGEKVAKVSKMENKR